MYLSNILFAAGWALLFPGIYALLCIPIWMFSYVILTFFEEQGLEEEYREEYLEYKKKVRCRFFPCLPGLLFLPLGVLLQRFFITSLLLAT